ncbi:MAG: zinc metalloprotease HtpX [Planctomycetes bacterium]|nr:zinc metalloprotease HtpX [Planctomycetota bacterium]MCC7172044.1 zinc metalloprotease HtpX [Planctomycetota bacterium]
MLNQAKTVLLLGVLSALLVGIGGAVAPGSLGLFLVLAIVMNVGAYFFSDRIVLRMHGAQEVAPDQAPDLHRMVEELAQAANIPKPRVAIIDDPQPNAFATGRNPKHGVVAVTTGILQILSRRELRGVLAHEIAHIQHRDILVSSIAAVLGSAISGIAQMLQFGALFGGSSQDSEEEGGGGGGLALALIAPIAAMLVQFGISRSREYLADEGGAKLSGDPEALANALLKLHRAAAEIPTEQPVPATASLFIVNPFAGALQSLGRWFSTHPPVEERVRRLLELAAWSGTPVPSRAI